MVRDRLTYLNCLKERIFEKCKHSQILSKYNILFPFASTTITKCDLNKNGIMIEYSKLF